MPEVAAVRQTGFLRGGRPGEAFWTDEELTSTAAAQDRLSLPDVPDARMEFRIRNRPELSHNGTIVAPAYGGRGGARQFASFDPVEVDIIDVQPLS